MVQRNAFECQEPRGRDIQVNRMLLVSIKRTMVLMPEIDVEQVERVFEVGGVVKMTL